MSGNFSLGGDGIPWESTRTGAECDVYIGEGGGNALEIAVTESEGEPTKEFLRNTYTDRRDGRISPVLIVAQYGGDRVGLCGPSGEEPMIFREVSAGQAQRVCEAALDKPSGTSARDFLKDTIPQLSEDLTGLHNQGLLSTHELQVGVPKRDDWDEAAQNALNALSEDPRDLLRELNYEIERINDQSHVLKHTADGRESAVAVFLREEETFEHKQDRFVGDSPVAFALREAEQKNLDYVIGSSGDTLRLYTTNPEAGFGSRGQTDTYVEVNTRLLDNEQAAYLWLLFSGDALQEGGSLHQIMEDSKEYATGLGERLRERIYDDVVPQLAEALAEARDLQDPTKEELDETYRMTLVLLYRLLFIAYAEDERFLPRYRNAKYDQYSIKGKARDIDEGMEFGEMSLLWDEVMTLTRAIHNGESSLGLPAYDGRLLSEDEDWTEAGYQLSQVELPDSEFGPALEALLIDETPDGWEGPVDFRNVGVREFGVIYEGLLESELSVADQDLKTEKDNGDEQYIPAEEGDEVIIEEGQVYLHGQSGERKATGTYYTKTRFVEHLLDYSLDPALEDHLERIDQIREEEGEAAAADAFFDFRTADISMGSGHFLVGAVDRIEKAFRNYLQETTLTGVEKELDNLKDAAEAAFASEEYTPDIERSQLLRRQIARRCIYGVDLNELATELARLSLWVHTFVPGLPLTFLDYNMRTGDSLAGIGTLGEVTDILDVNQASLSMFAGGSSVMSEIRGDLEELGAFADASAEQVREVRETRRELEERLSPVRARFDILAASRIDDNIDTKAASDTTIKDPTKLASYEQAVEALSSTEPLHFPAAFPEVFIEDGGFDVIIGNPPWEEATIEEDEFWLRYAPGLMGKPSAEQEKVKSDLRKNRPDLVEKYEKEVKQQEILRKILKNGPYPGMGTGDPDMYKAFLWRFWNLVSEHGDVGVVLPRSAFVSAGSEEFRRTLLTSSTVRDLTFVRNTGGWVFDNMEPRYTIALLSFNRKEPGPDSELPLRGPYPDPDSYEEGMEAGPAWFPSERAANWTGSASFPLLPPEPRAGEVFAHLTKSPPLGRDNPNEWRTRPYRELDATNDKQKEDGTTLMHFTEDPPEGYWPIYKGSSFDIWTPDTGDRYAWADPDVMTDHVHESRESAYKYAKSRSAFGEMDEGWVHKKSTHPCFYPRIAFRDVSRADDTRTVRTALVPPELFITNTAPYLLWPRGDESDEAYLLGVLSSIPLDWYARRFVELHLNFHIFDNLPVPRPGRDNRLRQRVVELSGRLAAVDERYADWADAVGVEYGPLDENTKQEKIYELDAVVAHLYGLTREHVEVIFETFHTGWDYEERLERVLDYYADWGDRLDLDHSEDSATEQPEAGEDD